MKRDIKLNMAQLVDTDQAILAHINNIQQLRAACEICLGVMEQQVSVSFETLSKQMEDVIIENINKMDDRMNQLHLILFDYIAEMEKHIMPQNEAVRIRVDLNDIWFNLTQIQQEVSRLEDLGIIVNDGEMSSDDWIPDTEEGRALLLEMQRRERNYAKIKSAKTDWRTFAQTAIYSSVDSMWGIYNNSIVPYEDTDNAYAKKILELEGVWGYVEYVASELWGINRGTAYAASKEVMRLADFAITLRSFAFIDLSPPGFILRKLSPELPGLDFAIAHAERVENAFIALPETLMDSFFVLPEMLKDPGAVLGAMGQSIMDTCDEEGIGFEIGNVLTEVVIGIIIEKGVGKAKEALIAELVSGDLENATRFRRLLVSILDPDGNIRNRPNKTYRPYTQEMRRYIIPPKDGHQAYVERLYIEIREAGLDDIAVIAQNTGLSEQDLIRLKRHLFLDTHEISYRGRPLEELYFQADPEIAHAWQRAKEGGLSSSEKEWFEQLLNHELTESAYMEQGMVYRDPTTYDIEKGYLEDSTRNAHDMANLTAPQPDIYPGYDYSKEFLDHVDDDIYY